MSLQLQFGRNASEGLSKKLGTANLSAPKQRG